MCEGDIERFITDVDFARKLIIDQMPELKSEMVS